MKNPFPQDCQTIGVLRVTPMKTPEIAGTPLRTPKKLVFPGRVLREPA